MNKSRIKLVVSGVGTRTVFVDGVAVAKVWGHRGRDHAGIVANFGIDLLDGTRIAEGYCYFADVVKYLPVHLEEAGVK